MSDGVPPKEPDWEDKEDTMRYLGELMAYHGWTRPDGGPILPYLPNDDKPTQ